MAGVMHDRGACMTGGMHGSGVCMAGRVCIVGGCVWKGVHGRGACMTGEEKWLLQQTVCILLECILISIKGLRIYYSFL